MINAMRKYFEHLWNVLQLDFRNAKLSWLLAAINVLLVILVVGGISISAVGLLRKLADDQGLVRVQYAGATAREELRTENLEPRTLSHERKTDRLRAQRAAAQ